MRKKSIYLMMFISLLFSYLSSASAQVCTYQVQQGKTSNLSKIEIDMSGHTFSGYNALSGEKVNITVANQDALEGLATNECVPYIYEVRLTSTSYTYYVVVSNDVFESVKQDIKKTHPISAINTFYRTDELDQKLQSPKEVPIYVKEVVSRQRNSYNATHEYHKTDVAKIYKDDAGNYKIDKKSKYFFTESNITILIDSVLSSDENVFVCTERIGERTGEKNGLFDCEVSTLDILEESGYFLTDDRGNPVNESEDSEEEPEKEPVEEITYEPGDDLSKNQLKDAFALCTKPSYRKTLKVVGVVINVVRILIPILIIFFGIKDLYLAIVGDKDERLMKAVKNIVFRVVAGVIIFLLPSIIQFLINLVSTWNDEGYKGHFSCCTDCALNFDCDVNSSCTE